MTCKNTLLIGTGVLIVLAVVLTAGCVGSSYNLDGLWTSTENPDYDADLYVDGDLCLVAYYTKTGEKVASDVVQLDKVDGTHYNMGKTTLVILDYNYLELYFPDGRHYTYVKQT